ncbi:MAG TPA: FeoB small GTPase domain-containing protein [Candidatus Wunengus californicus]|uniref:FeoB small GTPase domain-containing protein n=1 Tax=Candidatus Wunengus californicus TaxID=3367619 RepID=UPI004024E89D|nr:ferrous iron transporter B [Planctomycetota bacterium]
MSEPVVSTFKVALVGNPNVGKSVIFGLLTGKYVTVSNYPGTTVEVSKGICKGLDGRIEIVDTPGANSLIPLSEDELVARDMLLDEHEKRVIQVVDAKNLRRGLLITTQLAEMGLPVVLTLNMWDELLDRSMNIDVPVLQETLNIPIIKTIATHRVGINALLGSIESARAPSLHIDYGSAIEEGILKIQKILNGDTVINTRAVSIMLLSGDEALEEKLRNKFPNESLDAIHRIRDNIQKQFSNPLSYVINIKRANYVNALVERVCTTISKQGKTHPFIRGVLFYFLVPLAAFFIGYKLATLSMSLILAWLQTENILNSIIPIAVGGITSIWFSLYLCLREYKEKSTISEILGRITMHPIAAFPILVTILWVVYKLVGEFGAGTCVDFFENKVFGRSSEPSGGFDIYVYIPFIKKIYTITHINFQGFNYYCGLLAQKIISKDNIIYELFLNEQSGLIQVGLTYAIAIVFPIVGFFFLAFGIMEDSGYLPRLAVMVDKVFKRIGLNGKAVLPMVLGLGCDTMATLTTRILNTKKERIIATLLLALAIPCSAQLGVISGVLGKISGMYFAIYVFVISTQLLLVGYLSSKVLPGAPSDFLMEIPPFRMPKLSNIFIKTFYRIQWFLKEAVPLFMLGTLALFVAAKLGVLSLIERIGAPITKNFLGLPIETTHGFILGFLRRDYGAVSIFKVLEEEGGDKGINPEQLLVSLVVITLFIPCLANFLVMVKERGAKSAFLMFAFILPYSILIGGILRVILQQF